MGSTWCSGSVDSLETQFDADVHGRSSVAVAGSRCTRPEHAAAIARSASAERRLCDRSTLRRVFYQHAVAGLESVAKVLFVRRPAIGVFLGISLHHQVLNRRVIDEAAGGGERRTVDAADRDFRAGPAGLDAADAPRRGPRADIDSAIVEHK